MSMTTKPNDLAFPLERVDIGLTKREYFAAAAMQGLLASPVFGEKSTRYEICEAALRCADSLIEALNLEPGDV